MSNRTVLLSIDYESQFDRFGDYGPGIWQTTMSMSLEDRAAAFWEAMGGTWSADLESGEVLVGGVKDRNHLYPEVDELSELWEVRNGFHYDEEAQICYIKFSESAPWYTAELLDYGESLRFIDAAQFDPATGLSNQAHIDGVFVEPRVVTESFTYRQTVAPIDDNRMSFDDCSITLINADGFLDSLREQAIGRTMRVYYSSLPDLEVAASLSDFNQSFEGRIKTVRFAGGNTVTVTGGDIRASWQQTVNSELLTIAEFPDMTPDLESQYKNIIVGQIYRAPCVNVSAEGNNRTWSVNSVINGQAAMQALNDGEPDEFTPVQPSQYTYDPVTGVVVLSRDPKGDLRADMLGDPITSPVTGLESLKAVDVALVGLRLFANLPYIDSFWYKPDIDIIYERSPDVGIFIGREGIVLKDFIDVILASANTRVFLKSVDDSNGVPRSKFSMRDSSIEDFQTVTTINPKNMVTLPMAWGFDESAHMTSIGVKYNPRIYDDAFKIRRDDSLFELAYSNTPIISEYDYRTYCTDEDAIKELALQRYTQGATVPYRLRGVSAEELDFTLLDYVRYIHVRSGGERILPPAIWQVTEIDIINRSFELTFNQFYVAKEVEMQIGEVTWWPGAGVIPESKLICNGALYNPADYPDLFTVLGITWGGDGAATFGVPNMQGAFPGAIGVQGAHGDVAWAIGDFIEDENKSHTHIQDAHVHSMPEHKHNAGSNNLHDANNVYGSATVSNIGTYTSNNTADTNGFPYTATDNPGNTIEKAATNQETGGAETRPAAAMGQWIIQA